MTDALNGSGSMHYRVKPISPEMTFCGTAVTAFCAPMDNLAVMAALDFVQPGDVIVCGTMGQEAGGTIGDLWAAGAKARGVAALVTDGLVALLGAHGGEPGALLISGTGSVAEALLPDGQRRMVGGWGWQIGEIGRAHV